MLAKAIGRADSRLFWAAIDLMIPPFALLLLLDVLALLVGTGLSWLGSAHYWPMFCLFGALLLALIALVFRLGQRRFKVREPQKSRASSALRGLEAANVYWACPPRSTEGMASRRADKFNLHNDKRRALRSRSR